MRTRTVLLYGQSLLLSALAVGLAEIAGLELERARTWDDAGRLLAERMPDVLIFDLVGDCESHVLPLLFKTPHPTIVGLDTEHNQAVLLAGQTAQSLTLDHIRQIAAGGSRRETVG